VPCIAVQGLQPALSAKENLLQHSLGMDTYPGTMDMHVARLLVTNHAPTTGTVLSCVGTPSVFTLLTNADSN